MGQKVLGKILGITMSGSGIVAVLVILGIFLVVLRINPEAGNMAIWGGILIGILFGVLGIFGIIVTLLKRTGVL